MTSTDDAQITELLASSYRAWSQGDAGAYGDCFTADADYVSYDGTRAIGREPMVHAHDQLFRGVLQGSSLVGEVLSIRYIRPDVAIVYASGSVLMPWRSRLPKRRRSIQTLVAVREPDGWRFAANHTGRVRPVTIPAPDSIPARASQLLAKLARAARAGRACDAMA
jgi:uncharacterized protein (TIGR02246 family)